MNVNNHYILSKLKAAISCSMLTYVCDNQFFSYLLYDVTPRTVSLANVGATLLQTLVKSVTVQLADVAVLLVLLF